MELKSIIDSNRSDSFSRLLRFNQESRRLWPTLLLIAPHSKSQQQGNTLLVFKCVPCLFNTSISYAFGYVKLISGGRITVIRMNVVNHLIENMTETRIELQILGSTALIATGLAIATRHNIKYCLTRHGSDIHQYAGEGQ